MCSPHRPGGPEDRSPRRNLSRCFRSGAVGQACTMTASPRGAKERDPGRRSRQSWGFALLAAIYFFRPSGARCGGAPLTHGLRRGLRSYAATRLVPSRSWADAYGATPWVYRSFPDRALKGRTTNPPFTPTDDRESGREWRPDLARPFRAWKRHALSDPGRWPGLD